jgi:hypothetical protein
MGIRIESANDGYASLQFGDADDTVRGGITYNNADDSLQLRGYNNATRATIDTSGNLLVGNTVVNPASGFASQRGFGYAASTGKVEIATTANAAVMELGKNNANDGSILVFRKESNVVGSIDAVGTVLKVKSSSNLHLEQNGNSVSRSLNFTGTSFKPFDSNDNQLDLGTSGARFKDLYLSSIANIGTYIRFGGASNYFIHSDNANYLRFGTNGSEQWRINNSGHFTPSQQHAKDIGGTNAEVRNIYAQGISFASNANYSDMTSELLDDYEEGVYDATISCASGSITLYSSYTALRYTKIGRQVHVHGKLAMQAVSSPSGATNLNLPFTSANDTNRSGVAANIMTGFFNGSAVTDGIYPIYGDIAEASSNCRLFIMLPPATNNLGDNHVAAGSDIHVNFTYTVQ